MLMDNQSLQKGAPPVWTMIPSLQPLVEGLAPVFTQPSLHTCSQLLLGWVMCLGKHTLWRVGHSVDPRYAPDHSQRHDLDSYYNFFERSAWTTNDLAYYPGTKDSQQARRASEGRSLAGASGL